MASLDELNGKVFQSSFVSEDQFSLPVPVPSDGENIIPAPAYFGAESDYGVPDTETVSGVDVTDAANSYRLGTVTLTDTNSSGGTYPPVTYDIVGVNGDQVLLGAVYNGNDTWNTYVVLSNTDISLTDGFVPGDFVFSDSNPYAYSPTATDALLGRTFTSSFVSRDNFNNPDTTTVATTGTIVLTAPNYFGSDTDKNDADAQTVVGLDTADAATPYRLGTIALVDTTSSGSTSAPVAFDIVAENGDQLLLGQHYLGNDTWSDYAILSNSDIAHLDGDGSSGFTFVTKDVWSATSTSPAIPCFAAGTLISTPAGSAAVESLAAGDLVRTFSGEHRAVVWAGHRHVDLRRHANPDAVRPVRILAGSFDAAQPTTDLVVSPDHNLFADGVLIPAKCLVNGRNVVELDLATVTYHHIELSTHDVVLANGMPAETYLDTGNRANFAGQDAMAIHPDFSAPDLNFFAWEAQGYARLVLVGPELDAVRARLAERADRARNLVLAA